MSCSNASFKVYSQPPRHFRCAFLTLLSLLIFGACSARFVNQTELKSLKEKYLGTYVILKAVDIGNNRKAERGSKVKLYFAATSESVKVYAYPHTEPREEAIGNNILYLFEDDFPTEAWDREFFEKKLSEIVKKIK